MQYEDVVAYQLAESQRLVGLCGLEWEPQCASFHTQSRSIQTVSLMQVRQPVYSSSVGGWQRYKAYLKPLINSLGTIASE